MASVKSFNKTERFLLWCALSHPNGIVVVKTADVSTRLGAMFGNRRSKAGIALRNAGFLKFVELRKESVKGIYFHHTVYRLVKKAA